jgi:4-hydroxythreonine-4-phosphate dehydrogenase
MAASEAPRIAVTMGDPAGIGPEIIVKALSDRGTFAFCRPLVLGDRGIMERAVKLIGASIKVHEMATAGERHYRHGSINLLPLSSLDPEEARYGAPAPACGRAMYAYIAEAVRLAAKGEVDAITTAPINKKTLADAGYSYPGHTELLAELTGTKQYAMMLAGEKLKVVPVTIHCALSDVFRLLTAEKIAIAIRITCNALQAYFSLPRPRIAVAALNPHAGEGGLFGNEEETIIAPALEQARALGIDVSGPLPPDTLFYHAAAGRFDAVICMYHDQALIPLKLLHFDEAVNVTLGLPVIRTSVDHGTAYDIAGTGRAHPASLVNALTMAAMMAGGRKSGQ